MAAGAADKSIVQTLKPLVPAPVRRRLRYVQTLAWLPHTKWGDYLWSLSRFRRVFHRLPRKESWLLNDVLFQIRVRELTAPARIRISDKEHLRSFVRERVGETHNVPILAVLRSAEEAIAFDYPTDCVIKPTHMSAEVIFNHAGHIVDRQRIAGWFSRSYYREAREANYKTLVPKVIVEPYIFGRPYPEVPVDYRVFCVDGRPRMLLVEVDHATSLRRCYFDCDWRLLPFTTGHPRYGETPLRPDNLDQMLELAGRLSAGFSLLRADLYSDGKQTVVGELTNCSGGGGTVYFPPEGEIVASRLLWPDRWPL